MDKLSTQDIQVLHELSERTVYLMGGSFILGSLFTLLLLLALDFVRRNRNDERNDESEK